MQKQKQTLVFLPGMLNTEELWKHQEQALKDDFNIFHADIYNNYSLEGMAENILNQTEGNLILVGLSMGGYCALETLRMAPDRIKKIALFNTGAKPSTPEQKIMRRRLIEQSKIGRFLGVGTKMLDVLLGDDMRKNSALRKFIVEMAIKSGREVYARQQTAIINRTDCRPMIKKSTTPFLCVASQQDTITPPSLLEEINALAKNSEYYILPNCGHLAPIEFPEKCTELLKDWLKV